MLWLRSFSVALALLIVRVSTYKIPSAQVTIFASTGFQISIPAETGIKAFTFHGKTNVDFVGNESGNIRGQGVEQTADNGERRWIFTNNNIELRPGDTLYYWLQVQYKSVGYIRKRLSYKVPDDFTYPTTSNTTPTTAKPSCERSITTISGKTYCKGHIVFDESFDRVSVYPKWQHEVRIPLDTEDAEFVSYQSDESLCSIQNGMLVIRPKLLINEPEFPRITYNTSINLGYTCTFSVNPDIECVREAWGSRILPPVVSCKLNTKHSFRFTYGRIEIRAKLPKGDWLFPELFLEPFADHYGAGYDSGQIRIAYIRSNEELYTKDLEDIGGRTISGGLVVSTREDQREWFLKKKYNDLEQHFGDSFHVYTLLWTDTEISVQIDGTPYGRIVGDDLRLNGPVDATWRNGSNMAPFDQEFYLSVGIGAGGIGDFPDESKTGPARTAKPWYNDDPKAEYNFWNDYDIWRHTWATDDIQMEIDYVRVYAI